MSTTPRKEVSRQRLILRWSIYLCFGLAALALALLGALALINRQDEPLSAQTQDWLREPANPVPDNQNAFLAMAVVGIEGDTATATQRGRAYVEALRAQPLDTMLDGDEDTVYARQGQAWRAEDFDSRICSANGDPDVLPRLLNQKEALNAALNKHQSALQRYYRAIALPGFHEVTGRYALLKFSPRMKLACLARIDLGQRLMRADASAAPLLVQHVRYGLHSLLEAQTLIGAMTGQASVRDDLAWLKGLQAAGTPALAAPLRTLQPDLEALVDLSIPEFRERMARAEFRHDYPIFATLGDKQSKAYKASPIWVKSLYPLAYQANASTNLQREMIEKSFDGAPLSERPECQHFGVYNALGKMLACSIEADYSKYMTRVTSTQEEAWLMLDKQAKLDANHGRSPNSPEARARRNPESLAKAERPN